MSLETLKPKRATPTDHERLWTSFLTSGDEAVSPWERDSFFRELLAASSETGSRVLEVGSGYGRMLKALARHGAKGTLVGLDCHIQPDNAPYMPVTADARCLPFTPQSFDCIFSLGVVEHFPETETALCEQIRVLRLGGLIVVTVPHLGAATPLRWLAYWVRYRQLGTFEETLGRNLKLSYLTKILERNGVRVVSASTHGLYLPSVPSTIRHYLAKRLPHTSLGAFAVVIGTRLS